MEIWNKNISIIYLCQTLGQHRSLEEAEIMGNQKDIKMDDKYYELRLAFDEADLNNDEKLSFEETDSFNQKLREEKFIEDDKNHDGFLDWDETKQWHDDKTGFRWRFCNEND